MQAMSYQVDPDNGIDDAARQIREREARKRREREIWEREMPKEKICRPISEFIDNRVYSMMAAHAIYRDGVASDTLVHCPKKLPSGGFGELVIPGFGTYRERRGELFFRAWGKKIGA